MFDWLAERARISAHKPALSMGRQIWTYRDLDRAATTYAAHLLGLGVQSGDRIGILLDNSLTYIGLLHAIMRIGAVAVPLNIRLAAGELVAQIQLVGCKLLITGDEGNEDIYGAYCLLAPLSGLETRTVLSFAPIPRVWTLEQTAAILFTSSTTGHPRAVPLTFGNFFYSALGSAWRLGVMPDDLWLCVLPLFHIGGLSIVMRACLYGAAIHLHEHFDGEHVSHTLQHTPITLVSLVPTMFYRMLIPEQVTQWKPSLRLILLGGAAASPDTLALAHDLGLPIATTYGLTEAASQVATATPPLSLIKQGSVGKPLWGTSVVIEDDGGRPVEAGLQGEIVVSGPTVMTGYLDAPEQVEPGRLHTGDIGYLDEEGDLWVLQRRTDLIISGGENVYPSEVENVLKQHPAVASVCVVGIDHPEWGQQVSAAIVLVSETPVSSEALQSFCRAQLAGYKIPRRFVFVDHLPTTPSGKIRRAAVVDLF